jgi:hypothetical protein
MIEKKRLMTGTFLITYTDRLEALRDEELRQLVVNRIIAE